MAHHALVAGHGNLVGVSAEDFLDRQRLDAVVNLGAGAMSVDVTDVLNAQTAIVQRPADGGNGPVAVGGAVGGAVGVGRRAVPGDLAVDGRAASLRGLAFFAY